ncbi:MAG TPA: 1-phosphofructokinase family hexose kinase [Bauldia sp.]|nr:1-phosphofructokinase family hexose kinase [Bauldia sp.]
MKIVTLSLNPAIDVSSETERVLPTHKIRTANEDYEPGGGGVNVARVITELGGDASLICPAGGFSGQMLDQLLGKIPVSRRIIPIAGNTRISFTVFERKTGAEYRFTPNGPTLSEGEIATCLAAIREASFDYFVASGSVPMGAPSDILSQIADIVSGKGARFVLDSSGAGLSVTLERSKVYLVKPSMSELEGLAGRRLDDKTALATARDLVMRGRAEIVAVTMGAAGAMVVTRDKTLYMEPPKVEVRSAVGAGDAFLGAMTLSLARGEPVEEALMLATAAGAATTLTPLSKVCALADVVRLHEEVKRMQARTGGAAKA